MSDATHDFRPVDRSEHELLVVDDDPASLYATTRVLRSAGFRTLEAVNGADALEIARGGTLSAMVVDVHLPDIDGFELCRILRTQQQTQRLPVLHLSAAYVTDEDKVRGLDSGADAYLTHPVEPAVLVATVQALVRTHVAEAAMRRSESKFRAIYDHAPGGIGLLDDDGRFVDANPAMQRLLGRSADDLVGKTVADFAAPQCKAEAASLVSRPADGTMLEFALHTPDGREVDLAWSVAPQIEPGVTMVLATDVSQRTAMQRQRQQMLDRERLARGEAEKLSRMKDTFIAVLSHELRSPLNPIMGWTHVLQKRGGSEEALRGLAAIERNGHLQARMISDLLDMSRLNLGKLPLSVEAIDLAEVVESAVNAMRPAMQERAVDVWLDIPTPLRPIHGDGARLQQVVWNLLSNAIKFSEHGTKVRVQVFQNDVETVLTVCDEGRGIDPDFLPFVFDRFTQSDSGSNRHRGGLGLGLSIVKQLVEAHGGTVAARSEGVGRGACFEVRLPLESQLVGATVHDGHDPDEPEPSGFVALEPSEAVDSTLAGTTVLVVEDDSDAAAMLQIILADRGATVHTAQSCAQALRKLDTVPVDALISDIGMPGEDGYDLVRQLRQRERDTGGHLPAIALTSFSRRQDEEQALAAGFDAHCAKPLRPLRLVRLIQSLLERRA